MRKLASHLIFILMLALSISGCSSLFDKDNSPEPSPLPEYMQQAAPHRVWSVNTGSGARDNYLKMNPGIGTKAIYTASVNGIVTAVNKYDGRIQWQNNTHLTLTSGPGVGNDIIVVGSQHGEILALNAGNGRVKWHTTISGEILAQPAVNNGTVVIKTVNGFVRALSVHDGRELWSYQSTEPSLILRGASAPKIANNKVFAGFANGHLAKFNLNNGQLNWIQTVAIPDGAFSIQRMIDIDADPVIYDQHVYAATYQGKITSMTWGSGDILWSKDISSYTGMSVNKSTLYIADATGNLWSFNADNGGINWEYSKLQNRQLSGPAIMGPFVVVGDGLGFLHWINKYTNKYAARAYIDNSGIFASPIVENGVLYALSNKGNLVAYTIS